MLVIEEGMIRRGTVQTGAVPRVEEGLPLNKATPRLINDVLSAERKVTGSVSVLTEITGVQTQQT